MELGINSDLVIANTEPFPLYHDASFFIMMTMSHQEKVSLHLVNSVEENREVSSTFFKFFIKNDTNRQSMALRIKFSFLFSATV